MPNNVTVSIGGDAAQLLASLEVAKAGLRDFQRETNATARDASRTGDALAFAQTAQGTARIAAQKSVIAELETQIQKAAKSGQILTNTWSLNRGGLMELQSSGVNAFQALASGMDVFRVAMTEGAQVLGGLIQGGILGLSTLLNPLGALSVLGAAGAAALGLLAIKAFQTQQNLEGMRNELQLTGRGNFSTKELEDAADRIAKKWDISKESVIDAIKAIAEGSKGLTKEQVFTSAGLAAEQAVGEKKSISDTAKKYQEIKDSAAAIAMIGKEFNLPGTDLERLRGAGNAYQVIEATLGRIRNLLEETIGAQSRLNAQAGAVGRWWNETNFAKGIRQLGIGQTPGTTEDMLREHGNLDTGGFVGATPGSGLSDATDQEKALLAEVRKRESTNRYNIFHANGASVSTLADVKRFPGKSHAFGAYGFQPGTYDDMARSLGFDSNDISVANQDRAALGLLRKYGPNASIAWKESGPYPETAKSGAAANAPEQTKLDEEKSTRLITAEYEKRAIDHRHSLETQLKDLEAFHSYTLEKFHAGSAEEINATTAVERKKAEIRDQGLALDLNRIRELQAATTEPSKRATLQRQAITVATQAGAPVTQIQSLQSDLAGMLRQERQETVDVAQERLGRLRQTGQLELQQLTAQEQLRVVRREQTQEEAYRHEASALDAQLAFQEGLAAKILETAEAAGLSERALAKFSDQLRQIGLERSTRAIEALTKEGIANQALQEKWASPIKQAFGNVESTLSSSASGLLTGATTWAQSLKSVTDSIIKGFVDSITSTASKSLAKGLGATAGEGLFEFAGAGISNNLFGGAAGAAAGGGGGGGGFLSGILGGIGALFGFRGGGIVPSAGGGWALPSFPGATPALLHSREMVLPAHISDGIQNAISGGGLGGGVTVNLHAVAADGPAVARFFRDNGRHITNAVRAGMRNNTLTPASI